MELLINLILAIVLSAMGEHGHTSHYDPYVMEWQIAYHNLEPPCDGCAVASVGCDYIGDNWLLLIDGRIWPVVVADCAGDLETVDWMQENRILVELDYRLAQKTNCVGSCRVVVLKR